MIELRAPSEPFERDGATLRCYFAFGDQGDLRHCRWGRLIALNEGRIAEGGTYSLGPHHDVDMVTLVLAGQLTASVSGCQDVALAAGEMHLACTGAGVDQISWSGEASFMQIWLASDEAGGAPESIKHSPTINAEGLTILASGFPDDSPEDIDQGKGGQPLPLRSAARIMTARMPSGVSLDYRTAPPRLLYICTLAGHVDLNGQPVSAAALKDVVDVALVAREAARILLIDTD